MTLQLGPMGFDADHKPEVQVVASSYVSVCFRFSRFSVWRLFPVSRSLFPLGDPLIGFGAPDVEVLKMELKVDSAYVSGQNCGDPVDMTYLTTCNG